MNSAEIYTDIPRLYTAIAECAACLLYCVVGILFCSGCFLADPDR